MTVINLLKEKETRWKLLFTIFVISISCGFTQIPIYGMNRTYLKMMFADTSMIHWMDFFSGGSLSNLSMASFGITSYITASIMMQLLSILFPKLEKIRQDGEEGRKRLERIEILLAMFITFMGALLMSFSFGKKGLFTSYSPKVMSFAIASWMLGSFILIYLGKKVEKYGIGNGIMLILGCNILSRIPRTLLNFYTSELVGKSSKRVLIYLVVLIFAVWILYLLTIYLQCGVLNIPIKQTRKKASLFTMEGKLPMKVMIANVLPEIYASTLISLPSIVIKFFNIQTNEVVDQILSVFESSNWYNPTAWYQVTGIVFYLILLIIFGFYGSRICFHSAEVAEYMKKNGTMIEGVCSGEETIQYLERRRKVLSLINVGFLMIVTIIPEFLCTRFHILSVPFLGTSLIIIIQMLFDTHLRLKAVSIYHDKRVCLFQ